MTWMLTLLLLIGGKQIIAQTSMPDRHACHEAGAILAQHDPKHVVGFSCEPVYEA